MLKEKIAVADNCASDGFDFECVTSLRKIGITGEFKKATEFNCLVCRDTGQVEMMNSPEDYDVEPCICVMEATV